ncbi:MAG: hypothetical protein ABJH68_06680 [Ilumatobacter sp.]|uniref:hypothetical protein n=1 Tax=Ilumatobacter sp. TaxID=1967498 RepID=UPI003299CB3E
MKHRSSASVLLVAGLALVGCSGSDDPSDPIPADPVEQADGTDVTGVVGDAESSSVDDDPATDGEQMFPDVVDATAEATGDTWTVSATLSSPYDTPERYADAWRVVGPDGTVYGERILTHDHAAEQPFTRSQSGIEIPTDVTVVTIEGRDLEFGYGGTTFELTLPR